MRERVRAVIASLYNRGVRGATDLTTLTFGVTPNGRPTAIAARECAQLVSQATQSIRLSSGRVDKRLFGADPLLGALEGALGEGVKVAIVCGPTEECDSTVCQRLLEHGADIYHKKEYPRAHFMIVDDQHIRVELPHHPKAKHWFALLTRDAPEQAARLTDVFEKYLEEGEKRKDSHSLV